MELETKGAVIFMKKKIIVLLTIAILSLCNTSVFAEESGYIWTQGESGLWYYVDTEGNCKTGWQYINGCHKGHPYFICDFRSHYIGSDRHVLI